MKELFVKEIIKEFSIDHYTNRLVWGNTYKIRENIMILTNIPIFVSKRNTDKCHNKKWISVHKRIDNKFEKEKIIGNCSLAVKKNDCILTESYKRRKIKRGTGYIKSKE